MTKLPIAMHVVFGATKTQSHQRVLAVRVLAFDKNIQPRPNHPSIILSI